MMLSERFSAALVTGGAGLVGSNLVEDLLGQGLEVISLDDLSAGSPQNLDHLRANPNLTEIVGDISDKDVVNDAMKGVDVVFHQAVSKNTVCMENPNRDLEVNAGGTLNLLLAAVDHGVDKFVHASTGSVYGRTEVLHELDVSILRYYHVYGPGQDNSDVGGVIPIFIRRALQGLPLKIFGDGTQLRAFTYVKDVTAINMASAIEPAAVDQVYNCASDVRVTITQLAETILSLLGRDPGEIEHHDWKPGDIKHFDISNTKVKEQLGFEFGYTFEQGLDLTIDAVRKVI